MNTVAIPLVLGLFVFWLYAEFKLGPRTRTISGIMAILCCGFLVYSFCQVKSYYEASWHRTSIRDAAKMLKQGQTNTVIEAFETYNRMARDSTFRASQQMMRILERENDRPLESH